MYVKIRDGHPGLRFDRNRKICGFSRSIGQFPAFSGKYAGDSGYTGKNYSF